MIMSHPLFALVTVCLLGLVGCKQQSTTPPASTAPAQSPANDHGHTADGGHVGDHDHGAGPHDGTLADWGGGKFHVEFTVDHDKQEGTVYILGADEKTPTPIKAEEIELSITDPSMQVTLKAVPQEGDPSGTASRYVGNHEKLGVVQEYAGTIIGVVDDTPYSGDFDEVAHDH